MRVRIYFNGRYREMIGKQEETIDVDAETVEDVIIELVFKYPSLKKDRLRMMVLREGSNLSYDDQVAQDDILIIAPPLVSGG